MKNSNTKENRNNTKRQRIRKNNKKKIEKSLGLFLTILFMLMVSSSVVNLQYLTVKADSQNLVVGNTTTNNNGSSNDNLNGNNFNNDNFNNDNSNNDNSNNEEFVSGFSAVLYNSSNGLPTSESNVVAQTGDGFIWIGGYSGLVRYDGNEFYRYDSSIGISSVVSMYVDSMDRLWIGTNDRGVVLYEYGTFTFFGREEGVASGSVKSIAEDNEGNIFLATTEGMYYIDYNLQVNSINDGRISSAYICEIKSDSEGNVYGVTLDGVFFLISNLKITAYYQSQDVGFGLASCICPDMEYPGMIYIGTDTSEIIYGDMYSGMTTYKMYDVSPLATINAITKVGERFWICADNGIGYMDANGNVVQLSDIPMDNSVDEMLVDFEGNLWFASSRQGVMKMADCRFENVNIQAGLPTMVVNSTCEYKGNLYIGADNGLYIVDRNNSQIENVLTELLEGIRIRCIKEDSKGNLWLCTYGENGLVCYTADGKIVTYNEENGMRSTRVRTMCEISDGTIVVATSGGVNLIKDGEVAGVYDSSNGISNTEILCICEGENGSIYLGSDGDGIYEINGFNATRYGLPEGLESEVILRVKEDTEPGCFWIITGNSIAYMKDGVITTITNFPYSNNFDIFFDNYGRVWVISSNGIYVVNKEVMLSNEENMEYIFYNYASGLPCNATANSRSYIGEDGTLYISGSGYVTKVNINQNDDSNSAVKLVVPCVDFDDLTVYLHNGDTVVIPQGTKRFTIYGYVLTYALDSSRVSYYLEGFDDEPTTVSKHELTEISYTNLPGGRYTFHLAVLDSFTGEVEKEILIPIIQKKKITEQLWFWLLVIAIALGTVAFITNRINVIKTKKEKEELLEKQRHNNEFIGQMISALAKTIDIKDRYTNGHSFRVAEYSKLIAGKMGYSEEEMENVYRIGLLHDIGKFNVPDSILNKPDRLTDEEFNIIKQHAENGYDILKEIKSMPDLALGAGYHHERIDGQGYPSGKAGNEIPIVARIIAVADTFDAMNSNRPYRKHLEMVDIIDELKRVSGTQLAPNVVDAMLELIDEGKISGVE